MTARDVKNYRFIERALRLILKDIDDLQARGATVDKVTGSNPDYPYEQRGFRIQGADPAEPWDTPTRISRAIAEYTRLQRIKLAIEHAADVIDDPFDKIIWTGTMEGKSQQQLAIITKVDQSTISRKLTELCEIFNENA